MPKGLLNSTTVSTRTKQSSGMSAQKPLRSNLENEVPDPKPAKKLPPRVPPRQPPLQMMPSLKRKQEIQTKQKQASRFLQAGFPKGILLEIGLYLCSDKFKVALRYMRTCKTIYHVCNSSNKFWYYLFVQRYPRDFMVQHYIPLAGSSSAQPSKYTSNEQYLDYLKDRFDDLFTFEGEIRSVAWKEKFLNRTRTISIESKAKNLEQFKKVFIDSWRKQSITTLVRK